MAWKLYNRRIAEISTGKVGQSLNVYRGFFRDKLIIIKKTISAEFKKNPPLPALALIAFDFAVVYGVFHVITQYGVNYTICVGPSMIPTLNEKGDFVLIDVFSYRILDKEYHVGDVVISVCPYDPDKTVCKRIAAVGGDVVFVSRTRSVNSSYINAFSKAPAGISDVDSMRASVGSEYSNPATAGGIPFRNDKDRGDGGSADWNHSGRGMIIHDGGHAASSSSSSSSSHSGCSGSNRVDVIAHAAARPPSLVIVAGDDSDSKDGLRVIRPSDVPPTSAQAPSSSNATTPSNQESSSPPAVRGSVPSHVTRYSEPVLVPPGHVWLAGDNVNNSTDSRFYGPVPAGLLRGRVFTKMKWGLWPFDSIKSISIPTQTD